MLDNNDPRELLKILFEKYKFPLNSLSKITGIKDELILNYANGEDALSSLSLEKQLDLIDLIMLLTLGMNSIEEDERVRSIIETLETEFGISTETLALYANLDREEITNFLNDYTSIPIEKKYRLGITVLFLHYICK
ncbi:HTH domain-containing protein [Bacillus benzoevorans]|uniref:Uncharacterized protein n=1 Tax=Bacillus benzoevorans TaxID=1456 RepID=A0A7X0HUX6_9BACI|nr:HTH domain-containing protein [Bacillus benzoevorans]MBB6447309.1 hypothetical protein [Bacillus benzoevorans]